MVRVNEQELYVEDKGSGPAVVFAHGLLLDRSMYDHQVAALNDRFRCVSFDFRGQGRSPIAADGYDIDNLTDEIAGLIRSLGCTPCHFVGFSMGGFVGMRLAVRYPELIRSLILISTSAGPERHRLKYRLMGWAGKVMGKRLVARVVMRLQFSGNFLQDPDRRESSNLWYNKMASVNSRAAVQATRGVITRSDFSGEVSGIRVPTTIITGDHDLAIKMDESQKMAAVIPGSKLVVVPGAGHAVPIEQPKIVTSLIEEHLSRFEHLSH